jgi:hypothetical protein
MIAGAVSSMQSTFFLYFEYTPIIIGVLFLNNTRHKCRTLQLKVLKKCASIIGVCNMNSWGGGIEELKENGNLAHDL